MAGSGETDSQRRRDIDVATVFHDADGVTISEEDRLRLAKQILLCLALISAGVFVAHGVYPDNRGVADIFELIKIGALPLVTLVISFDFPNTTTR